MNDSRLSIYHLISLYFALFKDNMFFLLSQSIPLPYLYLFILAGIVYELILYCIF
ncbi:hypothetical protein C2G38_2113101, partial [Gigaspora rosea]